MFTVAKMYLIILYIPGSSYVVVFHHGYECGAVAVCQVHCSLDCVDNMFEEQSVDGNSFCKNKRMRNSDKIYITFASTSLSLSLFLPPSSLSFSLPTPSFAHAHTHIGGAFVGGQVYGKT